MRSRTRTCEDPPPKNGGQLCPGDAVQMETCNQQPCGDARGEERELTGAEREKQRAEASIGIQETPPSLEEALCTCPESSRYESARRPVGISRKRNTWDMI